MTAAPKVPKLPAPKPAFVDVIAEELRQLAIPPLTDAGNAERFAAYSSGCIRFAHGWDQWLLWDRTRWASDNSRVVYARAIDCLRLSRGDVATLSPKAAEALIKHAHQSERKERIEAMLALARSLEPIAVTPDRLDADRDALNVENGILDLRAGQLAPHTWAALNTKLAPVPFDDEAVAPRWTAFLERVVPDAEVRAYLRRVVGYCLTGHATESVLFLLYGTGANGKTVFLELLSSLLGDYARAAAPGLLLSRQQDRHEEEIADLRGARFVKSVEAAQGRAWDEARVKLLTGGDEVSARAMYGSRDSFQPAFKLFVAANHKPRVQGQDHGFWRRVHLIPFLVTIPEREQDHGLLSMLRAELPGILRWAVAGCMEWRLSGLKAPAAVLAAVAEYKSAEDALTTFLDECCVVNPAAFELSAELFKSYVAWAAKAGERNPWSQRAFNMALEEKGHPSKKTNRGVRLHGVALRAAHGEGGNE